MGRGAAGAASRGCGEYPSGSKALAWAASDSWFSHLAVEVVADGAYNEWLEAVSDEEYGKLK